MFDAHAQKNILIVMLQIFDNLFHYKNTVTVQWIKRLKLCMVNMATLPPAKELKIQVVPWQNEIRTLDVLKSPTCNIWTIRVGSSEYKLTKNGPENVVLNCQNFRLAFGADLFFELLLGLSSPLTPNKMSHLYQTDKPVLNQRAIG